MAACNGNTGSTIEVLRAYKQFVESDKHVKEEFVGWLEQNIKLNSSYFNRAERMGEVALAACLARGVCLEEVLRWFTTVFIGTREKRNEQ